MPDARIADRGERVCCLDKALTARLPSAAVRSPRDWGARQLVAVGRCCASTLAVHHLACDARRGQGMTSTASGRGAGYERDGAVHHPARRSHRIPLWWHGLGRPPHHLAHWLPNPHTRSSLNNQLQRTIQASSTAHHSTKHATAQPPVITDGRHRPALLSTHLIRGQQCAEARLHAERCCAAASHRGGRCRHRAAVIGCRVPRTLRPERGCAASRRPPPWWPFRMSGHRPRRPSLCTPCGQTSVQRVGQTSVQRVGRTSDVHRVQCPRDRCDADVRTDRRLVSATAAAVLSAPRWIPECAGAAGLATLGAPSSTCRRGR